MTDVYKSYRKAKKNPPRGFPNASVHNRGSMIFEGDEISPHVSNGVDWVKLLSELDLDEYSEKLLSNYPDLPKLQSHVKDELQKLKETLEAKITQISQIPINDDTIAELQGYAESKVAESKIVIDALILIATNKATEANNTANEAKSMAEGAVTTAGEAVTFAEAALANSGAIIESNALDHSVAINTTSVITNVIPHGGNGTKPKRLKVIAGVEYWYHSPLLIGEVIFNSDNTMTVSGTKYLYPSNFDYTSPEGYIFTTDKLFHFGDYYDGYAEVTITADGDNFTLNVTLTTLFYDAIILNLRLMWEY